MLTKRKKESWHNYENYIFPLTLTDNAVTKGCKNNREKNKVRRLEKRITRNLRKTNNSGSAADNITDDRYKKCKNNTNLRNPKYTSNLNNDNDIDNSKNNNYKKSVFILGISIVSANSKWFFITKQLIINYMNF